MGSLSIFFHDHRQSKNHHHKLVHQNLQTQLDQISSLMSHIDQRLQRARSEKTFLKILQDTYSTSIAGKYHPKILNVYHIKDIETSEAIGAYGRTTLEGLPPIAFFEDLLGSDKPIAVVSDKIYLTFFSPQQSTMKEQRLPPFIMLKIPLKNFIPAEVSLERVPNSKKIDFPQYDLSFFLTKKPENLLKNYLHRFWPFYFLIFSLSSFLYFFFKHHEQKITRETSQLFSKDLEDAKILLSQQERGLVTLQQKVFELKTHIDAMTTSLKTRELFRHTHSEKLTTLKNRLERKLQILVADLIEKTLVDDSLNNLLDLAETAQIDLLDLLKGYPPIQNHQKISLKDIIKQSLHSYEDLIFSQSLNYEINFDSKVLDLEGDSFIFQAIFTSLIHRSLERLKQKGSFKITVSLCKEDPDKMHFEVWDNGYNFDSSTFTQYGKTEIPKSDLLELNWDALKNLVDFYGGDLHQKNSSDPRGNTTILSVPLYRKLSKSLEQANNVIQFAKS